MFFQFHRLYLVCCITLNERAVFTAPHLIVVQTSTKFNHCRKILCKKTPGRNPGVASVKWRCTMTSETHSSNFQDLENSHFLIPFF
ncbi:MAG: hypothetical protein IJ994_05935 [Firmicutes bacterium]|nr:hypothetical protein [Bacillota bacterium]